MIRDESTETSDQAAQEVYIPVKKCVCADKQDDYKNRIDIRDWKVKESVIPSEPNWFHIASATGICGEEPFEKPAARVMVVSHLVNLEAHFQRVVVDKTIQEETADSQNPIPKQEVEGCQGKDDKVKARSPYRQNK